jgi:hypothetical protein
MPSALNRGDIVSIPLQGDARYDIGYILNVERNISDMMQKFIDSMESVLKNIEGAKQ